MVVIIEVVALATLNEVTDENDKAVCKSCLTAEPSAVSVRFIIGTIVVDALILAIYALKYIASLSK